MYTVNCHVLYWNYIVIYVNIIFCVRPLKLNNEFPVTRVCYVLKMAETLIIFIQMLIISI